MANFTAKDVNELRKSTGVGMMDCMMALTDADGDVEKSIELLRDKGLATQAKKAGRVAAEGMVVAKVNADNSVGCVVEVNSETDFVAKNEKFQTYVAEVAAQAVNTKEVSTWQSLREKYPSKDAIRDVLPYGSWQLPRWWHAPSAARCISPTECARSAAATTAVKSRSSSLWPRNKFLCAFAGGKRRFPPVFSAVYHFLS